MEIIIDNVNFWELEAMKYWSHPKTYDIKKKKEEAKTMTLSGNFIGSLKRDGFWQMIIKDNKGHLHARSRTPNVNGEYIDKIDWIPHIKNELSLIPPGTVLLGEIYFPNNEGSRKVTSVFNCLKEKCIERQKSAPLHYYVFDVLAYNGKSLINTPIENRIDRYLNYELLDVLRNDHTEIADYKSGQELWNLYKEIIANGGEGIVITRRDCQYLCGKRQARSTLKLKKELEDTIDAFVDGNYRVADKEYKGDKPETWGFWYNQKTGEKTTDNMYNEYINGSGVWIPVKKTFYMGWASAISFSVMKEGKPYHIGYISGITDEVKAGIVENPESWIGKVAEISAMEIEHIDGQYSLRHGRILNWRDDKKPEDCDFDQIRLS